MSRLKSPICELLGIEVPIVLAGMGGASGPELAAAVSNAGGLGVLGAAACGPDELREWTRAMLRSSKTPDVIAFRHDLPHTETGKLLRRAVLADLEALY